MARLLRLSTRARMLVLKMFDQRLQCHYDRQSDATTLEFAASAVFYLDILTAAACKYQESAEKSDFVDFFIFCPEKTFGELLSKIK